MRTLAEEDTRRDHRERSPPVKSQDGPCPNPMRSEWYLESEPI